jgi:hypothetical protein
MNGALSLGIGEVGHDSTFTGIPVGAVVYQNVQIGDLRSPMTQYRNPVQGASTSKRQPRYKQNNQRSQTLPAEGSHGVQKSSFVLRGTGAALPASPRESRRHPRA